MATMEFAAPSTAARSSRRGELALSLQEAFTVAARLRSNRQVAADATSFRAHIKQLLGAADRQGRSAGYDGELVRLAVYAYIAFLDESVLNSTQPMFAEWPRQPLQEEIFGDHMAGETFFRNVQDLLGRQDSEDLADLLEVYHLCLLLGFRGRYGAGDPGGLHGVISAIQHKIERIRGPQDELSPSWALPRDEEIKLGRDPWIRRLSIVALTVFGVAIVLFVLYRILLRPGIGNLHSLIS